MITLILQKKNLFTIFHCWIGNYFISMSCTSVNDKFDNFYTKSVACIDSHVKTSKKTVGKRNLKLRTKPWINGKIQKLMSYRDKLFVKMNSNPTESNKYFYRKFQNRAVSEQGKEKRNYFLTYFEKNKTNMQKVVDRYQINCKC